MNCTTDKSKHTAKHSYSKVQKSRILYVYNALNEIGHSIIIGTTKNKREEKKYE